MIEKIASLVNADAKLVHRGRFVDTTFMIAIDDTYYLLRIQEGRVTKVTPGPFITPDYSFALRASRRSGRNFGSRCRRSALPTCSRWSNKNSCASKATSIRSWPICSISRT